MFHYNSCHHYSVQVKTDEDVCGGVNELVFAPPPRRVGEGLMEPVTLLFSAELQPRAE